MAVVNAESIEICEPEEIQHVPKIRKLDVSADTAQESLHTSIKNLADFSVHEVLSNNTKRKTVSLLGSFDGIDGEGVVILEKTAFDDGHLKSKSEYFAETNSLNKIFHNDIYGNYEYFLNGKLNCLKTTIIHPASKSVIEKYSCWTSYLVEETKELYNEIVLPIIETKCATNLQWVYNILEHKSEAERIVYEDPDPKTGFILIPDLKWDGVTTSTLYLVAIVNMKGIKSLRDLTAQHLPLLKNVMDNGSKAIEDKYGLPKSQQRIYLHYQPSYYHLHIHFLYLNHEAPGIFAEKAHLLANVISNIEVLSDYYQQVTLSYVVRETQDLFKAFEQKGVLTKFVAKGESNDSK